VNRATDRGCGADEGPRYGSEARAFEFGVEGLPMPADTQPTEL
jgi:hypothetical protein